MALLIRPFLLIVLFQFYYTATAQDIQETIARAQQLFSSTIDQAESYRRKVAEAYAEHMRDPWEKVSAVKMEVNPFAEYPKISPDVFNLGKRSSERFEMRGEVADVEVPYADSSRYKKLMFRNERDAETYSVPIRFNGFDIAMRFVPQCAFTIQDTSEESLALLWQQMSRSPFGIILNDIIKIANRLNLCDWSLLRFIETYSDTVCASKSHRESVLMQVYILHSLGFRVCLAKDNNGNLYRLISTDARLDGAVEFYEDGIPYSLLDPFEEMDLCLFSFNDHGEYPITMSINPDERFYSECVDTLRFTSVRYPEVSVSVAVDDVLKTFYEEYPIYLTNDNPLTEFYYRASVPMTRDIQETVYPVLTAAVDGKTNVEALNILLDFVQTAFRYEMDSERWRKERFFFPGEIWFYDTSDCDDKAILFSRLVRDVLGLEVALVFWPGHLSCAVKLEEPLHAYVFDVSGQQFVSCDPTMPGACVGDVMPQLKEVKASLILL